MEALKILFLSIEYPPETGGGGIGSYLAEMAPALAARGHEVHVLSCAVAQEKRDYLIEGVHIHRRKQIKIPGIGIVERAFRIPRTIWRFQNGLSTYLEYKRLGLNFDVVEHPDGGAEGWLFALLHTMPLVGHLHTPLPLITKHSQLPVTLDISLASSLENFAIRKSDVITSPSRFLVNVLKDVGWLNNMNIEIIPYSINWPMWNAPLSPSDAPPTVLFIGRLERLKAPEILAQAISIIRKEIPEARALFVGRSKGQRDGLPYDKWLKRSYPSESGCQFIGQVARHELIDILSRCRVLALPSFHDNYPMVTLEAMASGRPVVVTSTSGTAEFVEAKGTGRVIPPGDAEALAEALHPFLEDADYAKLVGQGARSKIQEFLNPDGIAAERENIYQKAIESFIKPKAQAYMHRSRI
jgi:glycosyltransferase involved in cell wall biosynthesis